MAKLSEIEGVGQVYEEKLQAAGIKSVENLLESCAEKKARVALAEHTGISEKLILAWVNKADLCRINGVSTQYADLLEQGGVDSVAELAQRRADNLQAKLVEVNAQKNLVKNVPALSLVEGWIAQSNQLPAVVSH